MEQFQKIVFNIFKDFDGYIETFWSDYDFEVPHFKKIAFTEKGMEIEALDKSQFTAKQWKAIDKVDRNAAVIKWKDFVKRLDYWGEEIDGEKVLKFIYDFRDRELKKTITVGIDVYLKKKEEK